MCVSVCVCVCVCTCMPVYVKHAHMQGFSFDKTDETLR